MHPVIFSDKFQYPNKMGNIYLQINPEANWTDNDMQEDAQL